MEYLRKPSQSRAENQQTQPMYGVGDRIEPWPHWWKASYFTMATTLRLMKPFATHRSFFHSFLIGQFFLGSIKYSHQSCFFGAVWSGTSWDLCPVVGKANLIFTDMPTNAVTES